MSESTQEQDLATTGSPPSTNIEDEASRSMQEQGLRTIGPHAGSLLPSKREAALYVTCGTSLANSAYRYLGCHDKERHLAVHDSVPRFKRCFLIGQYIRSDRRGKICCGNHRESGRKKRRRRKRNFMSSRLRDAETRYSNSGRECYAIVKCLAQVRRLVMRSKHLVIVYTDSETLKPIFARAQTEKGRIATSMPC